MTPGQADREQAVDAILAWRSAVAAAAADALTAVRHLRDSLSAWPPPGPGGEYPLAWYQAATALGEAERAVGCAGDAALELAADRLRKLGKNLSGEMAGLRGQQQETGRD